MLTFFRTNQEIFNFLLLPYVLLLQSHMIYHQVPMRVEPINGILHQWLIHTVEDHTWLIIILHIILLFFQGVLVNVLINRFRLSEKVTLIPGAIYILFCSSIPAFTPLSPVLIANTFLIWACLELLSTFRRYDVAGSIFNTGFAIGLASLFYVSYLTFFVFILIALSILRSINIKEILMVISGLLSSYFLIGTTYLWLNQFPSFMELQFDQALGIGILSIPLPNNWIDSAIIGGIGFLIAVSILNITSIMSRTSLQVQKGINTLYSCLLITAFTLLVQSNPGLDHVLILGLPLGALLALSLLKISPLFAEVFHTFWLIVALALCWMT